ncbi:MAG: S1 RNA-binding domain-containing protein [Candidatus Micrarchaeia archaeon]
MQQPQKRFPSYGSIVIADIYKILKAGAYCRLPEYDNIEAFLPLKEISSGWIKNIYEYIHQGQRIVCKVIYIDYEKSTIDISLKKVTPSDSKDKLSEYNSENRFAALFVQAIMRSQMAQKKDAYIQIVKDEFSSYRDLMQNALENTQKYEDSALPKKLKQTLRNLILANTKEKMHKVAYILTLQTNNFMSGITELRSMLTKVQVLGVKVHYLGAPKYLISAEAKTFPEAEDKIKEAQKIILSELSNGVFAIEKEKLKKDKPGLLD